MQHHEKDASLHLKDQGHSYRSNVKIGSFVSFLDRFLWIIGRNVNQHKDDVPCEEPGPHLQDQGHT